MERGRTTCVCAQSVSNPLPSTSPFLEVEAPLLLKVTESRVLSHFFEFFKGGEEKEKKWKKKKKFAPTLTSREQRTLRSPLSGRRRTNESHQEASRACSVCRVCDASDRRRFHFETGGEGGGDFSHKNLPKEARFFLLLAVCACCSMLQADYVLVRRAFSSRRRSSGPVIKSHPFRAFIPHTFHLLQHLHRKHTRTDNIFQVRGDERRLRVGARRERER